MWGPRGFTSIEEHDKNVLDNFINMIDTEDEVYLLGDLMLNDSAAGMDKIAQIPGNIHIILGNHDTTTRIELYKKLSNVVEITYTTLIKYKKAHFYLSHYPTITSNNIDDNPWHKNIINLYGHTHQKENFYNNNPYMYHVGLDSHDNCPIEIEDIINNIREKKSELNILKQKNINLTI